MKMATYNIEWMNVLFENGRPNASDQWSARFDVTKAQQLEAIAKVIRIVDADVFIIQEAPNDTKVGTTVLALENFANEYNVRQNQALIGRASSTDQEIAALYDPKVVSAKYLPHSGPNPPAFHKEISLQIEEDRPKRYKFSKPPLELKVTDRASNRSLNVIGAHLKTKAPHGARSDEEARKFGLKNRRKQIAQAIWLRERVEQIQDPLVVAGDFNDGPGYDKLERTLGLSTIDILSKGGALYDPVLDDFRNVATARFFNREDHSYKEALLDFVFVNSKLRPFVKNWEIWHPFQNERLKLISDWREALLTASDHFPVCVEIEWGS